MISVEHLTKRFDDTTAVDDLSFEVKPGVITGFLGPNGSGKSTTMRLILGLDRPTKGRALVNEKPYHSLGAPLKEVGALLDAKAVHPGRSARNHLLSLAVSNNIPASRVDEVLQFVGLESVAMKRAGDFSLGMSQRLGIAGALLGDPPVLLFDEPVNGLDPEGIRWIREFFRKLADEGRTVLVSSHLMSEMAVTADQIIVIGRGKFITSGSVDDLTKNAAGAVILRSTNNAKLTQLLQEAKAVVSEINDEGLRVSGLSAAAIGDIAFGAGVAVHELTPERASLEEVFMELTQDSVEYSQNAKDVK
jgi:ABC-2 type transport system ATP-binding protein